MASKFYAVKKGKAPGIYRTWAECSAQVHGFSGAIYKSFQTMEEAESFMGNMSSPTSIKSNNPKKNISTMSAPSIEDILEGRYTDVAVAYVDGSYYHPAKTFSFGAVIAYQGEEYHFNGKSQEETLVSMRNVAGEIKGAECAMQFAVEHNCNKIYIYHDYEGIARWCLGEWKANKEGTKDYKAFYDKMKEKVEISFVKVKGHSNDKYNDLADMLAKQALGL